MKLSKFLRTTLLSILTLTLTSQVALAATYKKAAHHMDSPSVRPYTVMDTTYAASTSKNYFSLFSDSVDAWGDSLSTNFDRGNCYTTTSESWSNVTLGLNNTYTDMSNLGNTYFLTNGKCYIEFNQKALDKESTTVIRFLGSHELGHCFGLDDLGFFDSRDSIMSEHCTKNFYYPKHNDLVGVSSVYGLSFK